ncbi:RB1-inducible coiled-coil protein 1-like isoform X2 [Apostichopus japonicus]|uniref:RB1-inducible coiled-coil protein 1-like isoform X2 n=1 Tax=Stichopus japonicus TaxID=307972 RepID=UPI003AB86835
MLYVFLVNTGSMLTLDMSLTMESVQNLSVSLEKDYQVHRDKQVLMISGGQSLDPKMRVGSYCAGTDTNPIFLFSKEAIEAANPPSSKGVEETDKLKLQVEGLKNMPASMNAVVSRTQLALQFHDIAKDKLKVCEQLVHDQHLQQQGWMAVIANLEDITSAFRQRSEQFRQNMTEFIKERPDLQLRLSQFTDTLTLLEKIPLLPKLVTVTDREINLLEWISNQDQKSTLMQMGHQCQKAVDQFSEHILEGLDKECAKCLEEAERASMKEIKGLGERLFGLGQLVATAKGILVNQSEMAQGLVQNQTRVTNINDSSVLPDLCASHQQQLDVMLQKHLQLQEICRMCRVAKDELCKNLHVRLRWVMYIEQQISATHGKMVIYHENLKRLRKRLEIVRQVVTAPDLYANSLVEIIRRRTYDKQYIEWAGLISRESKTVHSAEIHRRTEIAKQLQHHFLSSLFPGMESLPPVFMINEVNPYNHPLPPVCSEDIISLAERVPELTGLLRVQHSIYYTSGIGKQAASLSSQESETQTTLPHQDISNLPISQEDAVAKIEEEEDDKNVGGDYDDDDELDIYTAGDNQEDDHGKETSHLKEAQDDDEPKENELEEGDTLTEPGRLLSDESDLSEVGSGPGQLRGMEFLSLKPSIEDLCLTSMNANEPFYSAISTPMDGNVPFLSTREEDLTENYGELENKIDSLRKKLDDMELTKSVLETEKTELEMKSQQSSAHVDKLQRDYETQVHRGHKLRNCLIKYRADTTTELKAIRSNLTEVKTDFENVRAESLRLMGSHYERLIVSFSDVIARESQRWEKDSEIRLDKERQELATRLEESQGRVNTLSVQLETLKSTVTEENGQIARIEQELVTTQQERDKLNDRIVLAEDESHKHLAEVRILKENISRLENALSQKEKETETLKEDFEARLRDSETEGEEKLNRTTSALKMESAMEIQDMEEKLRGKDEEIAEMQRQLEKKLAEGLQRIENEKIEALASLKREIERDELEKREAERKQLQAEHVRDFEELEKCRQLQLEDASAKLRAELETEKGSALEELREALVKEWSEKMVTLQSEGESEAERIRKEYQGRIDGLQTDLAESKRYEATPTDLSNEVMEESIETKGRFTDLETIEKLRLQHAVEMTELREMLEQQARHQVETTRREYELKMERIRQSMKPTDMSKLSSAEKQVAFNEAISRITAEKDSEIDRLKEREAALLEEQSSLSDKLENLLTSNVDVSSEAQELIKRSREVERASKYELKEMAETVKVLKQSLDEIRSGSPAELMVSSEDGSVHPADATSKLHALLHSKEQECISLKKQLQMHLRNTHMGSKSEKVSLRDIGVGDLVWIKFEEAHQNYVVFTLEATLYFVHSESVHALGLKTEDAKKTRDFALGRIADKEYCQAKKAQNRFKVPMGTKFYRVRVTAYDIKSSSHPGYQKSL